MYIIKDEHCIKPFAIIKTTSIANFILAIQEEFSLHEVKLSSILLPDFGDSDFFTFNGLNDDEQEVKGTIEVTSLIAY